MWSTTWLRSGLLLAETSSGDTGSASTWFVDNPWPPAVLFATAAVVCLIAWIRMQQGKWLIATIVCAAGVGLSFLIDQLVVSDAEVVEQNIIELTSAFQQKNGDRVHALISNEKRSKWIHDQVKNGLETVEVRDDLRVTDISVAMKGEDEAESHFRANATIIVRGHGNVGYRPSRWRLGWVREDGEWKVATLMRLNVIDGKDMDVMHRGE